MAFRNLELASSSLPSYLLSSMLSMLAFASLSEAADYRQAEQFFFAGQYRQCADMARGEVERGVWNEKWPALLLRCQLVTGQYRAAVETYEAATSRFKSSIALRLLGHEVYRNINKTDLAHKQYEDIVKLVQRSPWRYSSSADRITLGRFFLQQGEDAREVLELFYDRARKSNPKLPAVYLATAELALSKHDYAEAARSLQTASELQPKNPEVHLLQARAWQTTDSEKATAAISQALSLNPRHVPSLLFQADHLIDAERYDEAGELLTQVLRVNVHQPEAWAYHAVIAHLQGHAEGEQALRSAALASWSDNPQVDYLIGKKLSQKYRFAEAATYQRRALGMNPDHLPAKFQLSQDLLRLGNEEEGWQLADEVHDEDGYNVVAYNLVTLRDQLKNFAAIETDRFVVRMETREARIYGQEVIKLLTEAHDQLCAKYEVALEDPVIVEIFPQQKDFAIRTFGLPGGAGFLGVCFGRVITANSPASQGERPANWRSVLWHEFCHVVTLQKTENKIPRWLSEGISVYEEQEKDASWGERLSPTYRQMILDDELTPVSELSGAFLDPPSPIHLQFAYYESSLVVRYLVEEYGVDTLTRILTDLAVGMPINESLARYVGSLAQLDRDFAHYAHRFVKQTASEVDWETHEEIAKLPLHELRRFVEDHPNHYQALLRLAKMAINAGQYGDAEETLLLLRKLHPEDREPAGTLPLLASVYRRQERHEKEKETLAEFARLNDRALDAYARLCELQQQDGQWDAAYLNARRYLAVNPLLPRGHELLATAAEHLELHGEIAKALVATLEMHPVDPAGVHYRIATSYHRDGNKPLAKRHVLMALEHAPRYRDAQRLLLQVVAEDRATSRTKPTAEAAEGSTSLR